MITLEAPRRLAGEAKPWQKLGLSKAGLARFLNRARAAVGLAGEVHVLLAGDATLRRLNRQFRWKNEATDVLSFPAGDAEDGNGSGVAGDLAISLETAARQAARFGHSLRDEVRVLLLHGVLHLAGFDHEADAGEMAAHEAELRRELGVETSLIARVSGSAAKGKNKRKQKRNTGVPRLRATRSARDDGFKKRGRA
jgi:probable rRNA maturation factor